MKPLWNRLWIVGFGEIEDSSFPSLAAGATRLIFEELWGKSLKLRHAQAEELLIKKLGSENPFWKFAVKIRRELEKSVPAKRDWGQDSAEE
jgi:hypothetical protein